MTDLKEYAAYYVEQLGGPNGENAYHSLIEADDAIVPFLIEAFRTEQDPAVRSSLVDIVWHHQHLETVEFLSEALNDSAVEVWKSALDGLVALDSQSALQVLESTRLRIQFDPQLESIQVEWIDEAIEQIRGRGA